MSGAGFSGLGVLAAITVLPWAFRLIKRHLGTGVAVMMAVAFYAFPLIIYLTLLEPQIAFHNGSVFDFRDGKITLVAH